MKRPIILRGCRQHNLKGFDLEIPRGEFVVVSGVSGSGKSSLAFDTLYAEGQRRYVESFSAYARQFLDRMDRPKIDGVEGIPPAVAIEQGNSVRSSRSTVGTVTEINDYVKLLFAHLGVVHCDRCGKPVRRRTPAQIADEALGSMPEGETLLAGFELLSPGPVEFAAYRADLERRGFLRAYDGKNAVKLADLVPPPAGKPLLLVLDRITLKKEKRGRLIEAIEQCFSHGGGKLTLVPPNGKPLRFDRQLRCTHCDLPYPDPSPNQFSFNTPVGACPECKGFGRTIEIDPNLVVPDSTRSLAEGAIKPWTTEKTKWEAEELHKFCRLRKVSLHTPWQELPESTRRWLWDGEPGGWDKKMWFGIKGWFDWLETKVYKLHVRVLLSRYRVYLPCKSCGGARFRKESLRVRLAGKTIAELYLMPLVELKKLIDALETPKSESGVDSVGVVMQEIRSRLGYLLEVGLDYLTLERSSRTLSGGEMQRVNLTTAVGSALVNTLFVLDEPSIGLHPRDNDRLIGIIRRLVRRNNSVVVVEHDPALIRAADAIIDLGPKAGEAGGELLYHGPVSKIVSEPRSVTGQYLSGKIELPYLAKRKSSTTIRIRGARANNLKNLDIEIPCGALTCVSGVSGSGKSSLVDDVLYRGMLRRRGEPVEEPGACDAIEGWERFESVSFVDQSPLSRSPKSVIASYSGILSRIRVLFSRTEKAREEGFAPGVFSIGGAGGRCEVCEGSGSERVEMQFLADLYLPCQECGGARFRPEILAVRHQGKNIREIFDLTVDEALSFFRGDALCAGLESLREVGLGYLRLGQPLSQLSGGEAQRLKLGTALQDSAARPKRARTLSAMGTGSLFLFDEPTTGLHGADLPPLLRAFDRLLDEGHTLVVIEHHLDVIARAAHVIDLGPEGGERGGFVVAAGTPQEIARHRESATGRYLREMLGELA